MHIVRSFVLVLLLVAPLAAPSPLRAQETRATAGSDALWRADHGWGRFPVGSWKRVRVLTEMLDAAGRVTETSSTETTTTLCEAADDCFTLRVDVTVEVAGRKFTAQPKYLVQGYYGQPCDNSVTVTKQGAGEVTVSGKRIATEVRTIAFNDGDGKQVSTIQFAADLVPHVLHRETKFFNAAGEPTGTVANVEVIAVGMPHKVMMKIKPCWHLKTVQRSEKRTTVTVEVHCRDVPGGLVSHSSRSQDDAERPTERSTLELVDYGVGNGDVPQTGRRRIFQRNRSGNSVR